MPLIMLLLGLFLMQAPPAPASDVAQGITLYRGGEFQKAINLLTAALKSNPNQPEGWHFLGLAQYRSDRLREARKAFEKAVQLRPDFLPSRLSLGSIYLLMNDLGKAEEQANRVLSLSPAYADAHHLLGNVRLRKGEPEEALKEANLALTQSNYPPQALLLKSQSLIVLFAQEEMERGRVIKPGNPVIRFQLLKDAAKYLDDYINRSTGMPEVDLWRDQLETLGFYANFADQALKDGKLFFVTPGSRPTILYQEKAKYTEQARGNGIQGTVTIMCVFDVDGKLKYPIVLQGLSHGLNEQAMIALSKIRFKPAIRDGQPIAVIGKIEYGFGLY